MKCIVWVAEEASYKDEVEEVNWDQITRFPVASPKIEGNILPAITTPGGWVPLPPFLWLVMFWPHNLGSGLPGWFSGKESTCKYRRHRFNPWIGKTPWRRKWQPTPVFLPWELHEQRSLAGYGPWGHKELDTTERLIYAHTQFWVYHHVRKTVVFNSYCTAASKDGNLQK